ncbi:MAG: hypothetical protein SCK28_14865 [Bacillota bacterium]|nr:hypothetical protein [Bacillota bacterium]
MKALGHCNVTGIGSLPFTNISEGHELIRNSFPKIPHWPQLPKLGDAEGFINQYLNLPIKIGLVKIAQGRTPYFDTERADFTNLLTEFYTIYLEAIEGNKHALNEFSFGNNAKGFKTFLDKASDGFYDQAEVFKGQVSGPITLGLQITDLNRKASYYNDQLRDVLVKTLALHGKWQAQQLLTLGKPVVIFIDDPGLYSLGLSTHITLTRTGIMRDLAEIIESTASTGAVVGSHTCASTDWSMLFELNIKIVNFDSYLYFSSLSTQIEAIRKFLEKDGILAFGLIPTSENVLTETAQSLTNLFSQQLDILVKKGINEKKLVEQVMLTPSCGTGSLTTNMAITVYELTKAVGGKVKERYNLSK